MLKITYIISNLTYGGAERLLLDLCRRLDKTEFDVEVLVLKKNNDLVGNFEDIGVKVKVFDKQGKLDLKAIDRVIEYLKESKPDIVHTHLFGGDFWGYRAAVEAGIEKIVSTKHDTLNEGFLRNNLGRNVRQKMTKIIAISDAIQDYLVKKEGIAIDKITVIHNGIDVNRFLNSESTIFKTDALVIGSVGRFSIEKGQKHLIRACPFINNKNWKLILVGDGPTRKILESNVELLGLHDKVKFVGLVDDVRPYLAEMDVFVLPSISEGLSLAVLEAAASGKFIIATNVGGVPEIIRDNETGKLFAPKRIEELVRHLNWVDSHREEAIRMAKKLQKEVIEKFDINDAVKKYEAFYKSL